MLLLWRNTQVHKLSVLNLVDKRIKDLLTFENKSYFDAREIVHTSFNQVLSSPK